MYEDLLRCRPCGYVIHEDKLGAVCPACGLPRKVFEPYRERISPNRKKILALDLHPIAIHLSQTFAGFIPLLIIITWTAPTFYPETIIPSLNFMIVLYPFTLIIAMISGIIDGLTRFKTMKTPLIRRKAWLGGAVTLISFVMLYIFTPGEYSIGIFILSIYCLASAVFLGLWGKQLLDVILPGTYPMKKGKKKE